MESHVFQIPFPNSIIFFLLTLCMISAIHFYNQAVVS